VDLAALEPTGGVGALEPGAGPALLVGRPADPTWGDGALPRGPEVLELEGLDDALQVPGEPGVTRRVVWYLGGK